MAAGKLYDTDPPAIVLSSLFSTTDTRDRNGDPGNVADGLFAIACALDRLTEAAVLHVRVELGPPPRQAMNDADPRPGHENPALQGH